MAISWEDKFYNRNRGKRVFPGPTGMGPRKKQRLYQRQRMQTQNWVPARFAAPTTKKVELKYADNTFTDAGAVAGFIGTISNIANGTGPTDRIGRHVFWHNLNFNWVATDTGGGAYNHNGRILLVYDLQTNGANPTVLDVMNTATVNSQFNPDNRSRFKILYDQKYSLVSVNAIGVSIKNNASRTNDVLSLRGKKCLYSGTTTAITDIESGNILFIHLSDTAAKVTVAATIRLQFFD